MSNPRSKPAQESRVRSYWIYGVHAVAAALANPRRQIKRAAAIRGVLEKMKPQFDARGLLPEIMQPNEISRFLPRDAVHQGVVIEVMPFGEISLHEWFAQHPDPGPLLLLDQVTDPHNVGAILRSAAAFGAGAVAVTRDHAPPETAALAKAASGALEIMPLVTMTNLSQALEWLKTKGFWCVGLDGEAEANLSDTKLDRKTAFVLGAEGKGLRRLTAERCDLLAKLPISAQMESFNVSNAAAVALYEYRRGHPL